ncbi:hypothetical protein [Sphingomonas montanisoli]|uniref:Uncharacterized protein n=1 Tax=Sphingomonas montanisoli TaxID=2606412 RepID=A0A5D9C0N6_9SPHN|nr:hypothetical protein [Sphingomonas montanisoli]TZG24590.1 hypothetical protein FYJ91_18360 [Sphingomonas montanisoli]
MDDAVAVLQAAVDRCKQGKQRGADVRLALRVLRFAGIPGADLRYFWESCLTDNEIGRSQNMSAALNRIKLQLPGLGGRK